ncbi:MAG: ATP-dependent DNA ligase [Gemmatimonadota bacterium]|nr:ATP-dependent DNA ligase [Gemmatimonadota bacterium]
MEALSVNELPAGVEWQYEPKWDGFRCLAFREDDKVELRSKSGRSLSRYFPEIAAALLTLKPSKFVLDGELVVTGEGSLSFDALLQRIHPAASRVKRLATDTPAIFVVFDILVDDSGDDMTDRPLSERRPILEQFASDFFTPAAGFLRLSPRAASIRTARAWLKGRAGLDGVIAKRRDLPYASGDRTGMQKVKRVRTADCVVGGFRYASKGHAVGSLLLGLYNHDGLLDHIGFTSSFTAEERKELLPNVEKLMKPPGFTGKKPGGPSRWSTTRSSEWEALAPKLVVEVTYDHFSGDRFRHGTGFVRWRPDKAPRQCTMEQVGQPATSVLTMLAPPARKR